MNPKTRRIEYYVDLFPGWQDNSGPYGTPNLRAAESMSCGDPMPAGYRRFRVLVDLPCFGGSAEAEGTLEPVEVVEVVGEQK